MLGHTHRYFQLDKDYFEALTKAQWKRTLMMDLEHEANTKGDSGSSLRQRRPQGSVVGTCVLYIYIHICNFGEPSVPLRGHNHIHVCVIYNFLNTDLVTFVTFGLVTFVSHMRTQGTHCQK